MIITNVQVHTHTHRELHLILKPKGELAKYT